MHIGVIGGGIFGLAAAIELRSRGHGVTLCERNTIPSPDASSTDVSKAIRRIHYPEEEYVELVTRAARQWSVWQERTGSSIYHRPGFLSISPNLAADSVVHRGHETLERLGVEVKSLSLAESRRRFPQLVVMDGDTVFYDPWSGYLRSGEALAQLADLARADGVEIREVTTIQEIDEKPEEVRIISADGDTVSCDRAIVSAGPWITLLLPQLQRHLRITRQQMAFFAPRDPDEFRREVFPTWSVPAPGNVWYGFPLLDEGYVKVAEDNKTLDAEADSHREPTDEFLAQAREFVAERIPALVDGELVGGRSCLYTNTEDNHFVVDWAPDSHRVLIAGCGNGHGFKFGGAIGPVIADAIEDRDNPLGRLFKIGERFAGEN